MEGGNEAHFDLITESNIVLSFNFIMNWLKVQTKEGRHTFLNQKKSRKRKKNQPGEPPLTGNHRCFQRREKPPRQPGKHENGSVRGIQRHFESKKYQPHLQSGCDISSPTPADFSHYLFLPSFRCLAHFLFTLHQLTSPHSFSLTFRSSVEISLLYVSYSSFTLQSLLYF